MSEIGIRGVKKKEAEVVLILALCHFVDRKASPSPLFSPTVESCIYIYYLKFPKECVFYR